MTEATTGTCRHCHGPAPLDANGVIDRHREQILGAHGWVDGYANCRGKGARPKPDGAGETAPRPRGICSVCGRDVALLADGRIGSQHYPCPGAGLVPAESINPKEQ